MACTHVHQSLRLPGPNQAVYREDCTLCFDSIDTPGGLDVCLTCFNGGCAGDRHHGHSHSDTSQHPLAVNIRRSRKRTARDEPPAKISKLSIQAETEEDRYDTRTSIKCFQCKSDNIDDSQSTLKDVVQSVLKANTFSRQEEVKAWEQEMIPCEHTLCLEQQAARVIASQSLGHCSSCDLNENLWLCLSCGNLGCGRTQYGGSGGNSHGVAHTETSGHPVAVKLGSLSADGSADIYCYACNEERTDPELVKHLAHWGIDIAGRQKTEKSLTEQQIEQNLRWEFSMTDDQGKELKPMFGPGLTGLKNLGNSCYLASVVQSLFSMPEFAARYHRPDEALATADQPAEDLETQLRKMADGLLSGRYSHPDSDVIASIETTEHPHQKGLAPAMLKHLIGRGHPEFSTMRQQDAFEFLLHILKLVSQSQRTASASYNDVSDPVDAFRFVMEQKLQCQACHKVRYKQDRMENISVAVPIRRISKDPEAGPEFEAVTLEQCLDDFTSVEVVELTCDACGGQGFTKQSLFKTFPVVLAVNARRFEIVQWVPTKQDVPVIVGDGALDFDKYRSKGPQPGEELLAEVVETSGPAAFVANAAAMSMLQEMGFPAVRCEKALYATGNTDPEAASMWLFEHMEDPDIDTPLNLDGDSSNVDVASLEKIENLGNMGFGAPQARQALKETGGDMERAVDWLFSHPDAAGDTGDAEPAGDAVPSDVHDTAPAQFKLSSIVCHKGGSIHAGHYVAFIRKEEGWVLFNDEKVALGGDVEMKKFAYIYFFRRQAA